MTKAGSEGRRAAIEAIGVSKVFGTAADGVRALDNVSVTIRENEFFTLLGPSGCGKTTLLRLIAGFDFPTGGQIRLYGEDISPLPFGPNRVYGPNAIASVSTYSSVPSARSKSVRWMRIARAPGDRTTPDQS